MGIDFNKRQQYYKTPVITEAKVISKQRSKLSISKEDARYLESLGYIVNKRWIRQQKN